MIAYDILEKLWRLNRIFCSTDYDTSLSYLQTILPFKIHEYRSSTPLKGWVIPPKWDLVHASIKQNGNTLFLVDHPLKIIGLSLPFHGVVTLEELKKHLYYDHRNPESIPYHFRQHYRPWERDWGFCVTKDFYDSLSDGNYEVEIETKESEGYLKVAEYVHEGDVPEGFAFVAHLDHPGMANDDLAGVAVGVELFHQLRQMKTKFTYRLVLVQEMIGSVFYLHETHDKTILESCFLEMLGSDTPLALQNSRTASSCLENTLLDIAPKLHTGSFRSIVCNDEAVWESYRIPMCSLSRYPYPEYHSDKDNMAIISNKSLASSVDLLKETINCLDKKVLIKKLFHGVHALAHPDYQLYIDPGQPAFNSYSEGAVKLRAMMDEIPLLPEYCFADTLAKKVDLPVDSVIDYLKLWQKKRLIHLI